MNHKCISFSCQWWKNVMSIRLSLDSPYVVGKGTGGEKLSCHSGCYWMHREAHVYYHLVGKGCNGENLYRLLSDAPLTTWYIIQLATDSHDAHSSSKIMQVHHSGYISQADFPHQCQENWYLETIVVLISLRGLRTHSSHSNPIITQTSTRRTSWTTGYQEWYDAFSPSGLGGNFNNLECTLSESFGESPLFDARKGTIGHRSRFLVCVREDFSVREFSLSLNRAQRKLTDSTN